MHISRRRISVGLAAASLGLGSRLSWAQSFPSKALKIIVPFPAGGTTDVVARMVAQRMSESMGQPVVVENRGGAGGAIGADAVAKSAPDGHTLLMHNLTFPMTSVAQTLAGRSAFNVETDLIGVSISVYVPFMWTAHPSVPAKDLRELGQVLRSQRLPYNYGSTGPGSAMHVQGEAFKKATGVEMQHVPFRGAAPLKQELLAGRIQVGGDQLSTSLAEIKAGTLKALATTASKRVAGLPDVPTVRELGFPSLELEGWNGLFVPSKTPRDIVERLQREAAAAVRHPEVSRRLIELGAEPVGSSAAAQDEIYKRQMDQFRPIIKDMNIES
jgi:tripartite-type tricarboxylate transporter receptor subunit TctC